MVTAYLALENGQTVAGTGRVPGRTNGELVFTTAFTGYEESLTDPSYAEQILTFAYPLIGNYGVQAPRFEDDCIHPNGVIARELTDDVVRWLADEDVPAIDGIDTRDLVTDIRTQGAMQCGVAVGKDVEPADAHHQLAQCTPMGQHTQIGRQVSVSSPVVHNSDGSPRIALIDCGTKASILASFLEREAAVYQLPCDATPAAVRAIRPDLLFLSNGPGDPATYEAAERLVREFVGDLPIAGICLGQQIVAQALGGRVEKMEFGHRGVNQPVKDLDSTRVVMTTQNHGYTVAETGELSVTQINVNDGTIEGLQHDEFQILTRQYHPEAHPGPRDTLGFFDDTLSLVES